MRVIFRAVSRMFPSSVIAKGIGNRVILPFYHLVSNTPPLHVNKLYKVVSVDGFERDLDYLLKYFTPVDAFDLVKCLNGEITFRKPAFFLSFDDGFREVKDVISPVLLRKGIPATFLVNPVSVGNADLMYRCKVSLIINGIESVGIPKSAFAAIALLLNVPNSISGIKKQLFLLRYNQADILSQIARMIGLDFNEYLSSNQPYLTLNDLETLSKLGFAIGGHGYNHQIFNERSYEEQVSDVKRCMQWIGDYFPNQPKLFAFPFTDYGVSDDLLKGITSDKNPVCDISFGTSGVQPIRFGRNLQRVTMEYNGILGSRLVDSEILYYLAKEKLGYYKK